MHQDHELAEFDSIQETGLPQCGSRRMLDENGFQDTKILASNDLDEFVGFSTPTSPDRCLGNWH